MRDLRYLVILWLSFFAIPAQVDVIPTEIVPGDYAPVSQEVMECEGEVFKLEWLNRTSHHEGASELYLQFEQKTSERRGWYIRSRLRDPGYICLPEYNSSLELLVRWTIMPIDERQVQVPRIGNDIIGACEEGCIHHISGQWMSIHLVLYHQAEPVMTDIDEARQHVHDMLKEIEGGN